MAGRDDTAQQQPGQQGQTATGLSLTAQAAREWAASRGSEQNRKELVMRNRFTLACFGLAAGVAVTAALSLTAAGAASASTQIIRPQGTPSCGVTCLNVSNLQLDQTGFEAYVMASQSGRTRLRNPVVMDPSSNSTKSEDWTVDEITSVYHLCAVGYFSPTSVQCLRYDKKKYKVYEVAYSPRGVVKNRCVGVSGAPYAGQAVTLQPCGDSADTLWILDPYYAVIGPSLNIYMPVINGGNTSFSHSYVLTEDGPYAGLTLENLNKFSDGTVYDSQEFSATFGVLP
jgi:hypothetical protein